MAERHIGATPTDNVSPMRAHLIRRELRGRPGRIAWLFVAATVAVSCSVAAFGFSNQIGGLLTSTSIDESLFFAEGSITVTADASSVATATSIDEAVVETIRGVDGVALAEGTFDQPVQFDLPRGAQPERPVALRGVVLSSTFDPERWRVVEGTAPINPTDLALDAAALAVAGAAVGDEVLLGTPARKTSFSVVARVEPVTVGDAGSAAEQAPPSDPTELAIIAISSAHAVFPSEWIEVHLDARGRVDRVSVVPMPGTPLDDLRDRIDAALPDTLIVSAATDRAAATQQSVQQLDDSVQRAVGAVAVLSALISALVITNTLLVLVAQRTQEFGLLRALGASRRQIVTSVFGQSVIVGIAASILGIGIGVVLAAVAVEVARPGTAALSFSLSPDMVGAGFAIGVFVTALGAVVPALRAGRVAPMEALSESRAGADTRRSVVGPLAVGAVGVALLAFARQSTTATDTPLGTATVALGAVAVFIAITWISRWLVAPLIAVPGAIGAVLFGAVGRLSRANVRYRPSRSAAAGSALLVGLTLVGVVAAVGASARSTVADAFDTASTADRYLERRGVVRVSTSALRSNLDIVLSDNATYALLSSFDGNMVGPGGRTSTALVTDVGALSELAELGVVDGSLSSDGGAMLSEETAARLAVTVGDQVDLSTFSAVTSSATVSGIYRNTTIAGPALIDRRGEDADDMTGTFELGLIEFGERGDRRASNFSAEQFPLVRSMSPHQFDELNTAVTDTVLRIIAIILVGMIGIGYLGLAATLGLSTLERRHELRMLRSIGALRGEVRSMVLLEAMLIATVSAIAGLGVGTAIGVAAIGAMPPDLADHVVIPWALLVGVGAVSVVLAAAVVTGVSRRAAAARMA